MSQFINRACFFFVIHENLKSMLLFFKIFLNDNKNNTRIINWDTFDYLWGFFSFIYYKGDRFVHYVSFNLLFCFVFNLFVRLAVDFLMDEDRLWVSLTIRNLYLWIFWSLSQIMYSALLYKAAKKIHLFK